MRPSPRTPRASLSVEHLETRCNPSDASALPSAFAVGTDADPTGNIHATVSTYKPNGGFLDLPNLGHSFQPFGTFTGGVRPVMADFNGDGTVDLAVASGPGDLQKGGSEARVYDGKTGQVIFDQIPFDGFNGGLFLAAADTNNNGAANLVVTPDQGGSSRTTVYGGKTMNTTSVLLGEVSVVANFLAIQDDSFRGGARPAAGDINGDGYDDIVVSAGFLGGPRTAIYDGFNIAQHAIGQASGPLTHLVPDFFLFESSLRNGSYVAVGDVNGDGKADLIGGGGPGGGPRVRILSGALLSSGSSGSGAALNEPIANFFAGDTTLRNGIRVAAKNLTGDSDADILTGDGAGSGSRLNTFPGHKIISGDTITTLNSFNVFPGFTGGIFIG